MAPALNSNIWYTQQESIAARIAENSQQFDGQFILEGITTDDTPTELLLRHVQTEGLTANSDVVNTELTRLALPHKGLTYLSGDVLAIRTDTAQGSAHMVAQFAASVYHPDTNNAAVAGTNAIVDAGATLGNPAEVIITGDAADLTIALNTAGYLTFTVVGNASETIAWRIWINRVRSLCDPNYVGRNI